MSVLPPKADIGKGRARGTSCRLEPSGSRTNFLLSKLLSVFCLPKFPVPMRREFRRKRLNFRLTAGVLMRRRADFRQISLHFPCFREFSLETGSI